MQCFVFRNLSLKKQWINFGNSINMKGKNRAIESNDRLKRNKAILYLFSLQKMNENLTGLPFQFFYFEERCLSFDFN